MDKKVITLIRRIYGIILSASIIIAGACLIAGCLYIYYSGGGYSSAIVTETFFKICIPVYVCLALAIISFVFNAVFPDIQKDKPIKHYNLIYFNLLKKRDISTRIDELNKLESRKKMLKIINISVIAVCSVAFLTYALNGNNFHTSQINSSMIKAMWVLFPCVAVSVAFSVINYYQNLNCTKKQIVILKELPIKQSNDIEDNQKSDKKIIILKYVILAVGIIVVIFGAVTGGFADVLTKAVNICTECIGLG